jgi:DNA-binding response OmpR family regulator
LSGEKVPLILIVEDSRFMQKMISVIVSKNGWSSTVAVDYPEAMKKFNDRKPDIVLLDLHLPGKSGLEILKEMKSENDRVEVIVVTGTEDRIEKGKCMEYGAYAVISKPFTSQYLKSAIDSALKKTQLFDG